MKIPIFFLSLIAGALPAAEPTLVIDAGQPVAQSSPLLYGLMTEEINYSYDGGLYAELVRNRVFLDDAATPVHWSALPGAVIALDPGQPLNAAIPTSLRMEVSAGGGGVANDGYWGIPVKPSTRYRASFYAKAGADFSGSLTISLRSGDKEGAETYATSVVTALTPEWKYYETTLTTAADVKQTSEAQLVLTAQNPGTVWLGLVSLFPPTWKDRPNGLRPDLMQMLVNLKPAFLRFPGGNYLEGDTLETRFDWKKTLGPVSGRSGHPGPWGYRSTDGMGLMEFLLWCEDMGAEPVLALYAGYSLKGAFIKSGPDLDPYVQDALDEIEYVTGPITSKWGAQRAKDGHPEPFKLRYVEIGNEDFFDKSGSYDGRFARFYDAIKKEYPGLKCISSVGNEQPEKKRIHSRKPDALDEHYYRKADEFLKDSSTHFNAYDRKGPEIFVGEWAAYETSHPPWNKQAKNDPPTPDMKAALADAAWMTAMEPNSDIVTMQCYAPLFANVHGFQWRPNLIGYDGLRSFGSPSYYAIRMFSTSLGDSILKTSLIWDAGAALPTILSSVTRDSRTGVIYLKLVNPQPTAQSIRVEIKGGKPVASTATVETLSADPGETNSIEAPDRVVPVTSEINNAGTEFIHTFPANSISVLKLKTL